MAKILITGGSGLVGRRVTELLVSQGHCVVWLSREAGVDSGVQKFRWSVREGVIDPKALTGVEHIIHLAGANIIGKRWTNDYKREMVESRVRGAELLHRYALAHKLRLLSYTGASAAGFYGAVINKKVYTEDDSPGVDFLAQLCVAWEKSHSAFYSMASRTVIVRSAVVLARGGGPLKIMRPFFRAGLGAAVAPGHQHYPWIHIDDIARLYADSCFNNKLTGVYNGGAPGIVTNRQFTQQLAHVCGKRVWLPAIPQFVMRAVLGEAASTITTGAAISSLKLQNSGFDFRFSELSAALSHLAATTAI